MKWCSSGKPKCYNTIHGRIKHGFSYFGKLVGNHPWKVIILITLVNTAFGICAYWTKKDFHLDKQFRPPGSQAEKDKVFLSTVTSFQYTYERQLVDADKKVEIIMAPYNNYVSTSTAYTYTDIFSNIFGSETCPYGPNDVLQICGGMDSVRIFRSDVAYNWWLSSSYRALDRYPYVLNHDDLVYVHYAQYVPPNTASLGAMNRTKWVYWPKFRDVPHAQHYDVMVDKVAGLNPGEIHVYTDELRDETLYEDLKDSALWYVGTFTLLNGLALLATWTAGNNNIGNPVLLVFVQLISTALACASGIGFWVTLGLKINVFVLSMAPLMTQVLGLFRLFLQISTLSDCGKMTSTGQKIGGIMGSTGVAITFSYLIEVGVVIAAALSCLGGLSHTFLYLGTIGFMGYLNQMTFVPACLSVYDDQAQLGLHCIFCFRAENVERYGSNIGRKIHNFFCTGHIPRNRKDIESYADKLLKFCLQKLIALKVFQIVYAFLFVIYVSLMIWQATNVIQQDRVLRMVSPGTTVRNFLDEDENFEQTTSISFTIHEPIEYSSAENQQLIENLIQEAQNDPNVHDTFSINWLHTYKVNNFNYDDSSEYNFVSNLYYVSTFSSWSSWYSRYTVVRSFVGDYGFSSGISQVTFSRFYVLGVGLTNSKIKSDLMARMRTLASDSPLPVTAFSPDFLKYEQYPAILTELYMTLGIPTACLVGLFCLLLPFDIFSILYITITAVSYTVCIFGCMSIFTIHFNFITMVPVLSITVIGISVSVLVCFEHAQNGHLENRGHVAQTIETCLVPVLKVCLCVMIGLLCIVDSSSYVLYTVFCIYMFGFVNIILHHLILFPVLMSLFGDLLRSKVHPIIFLKNPKPSKNLTNQNIFWIDLY